MDDTTKAKLQKLLDDALEPLFKQIERQGEQLSKLDTPTGTEVLRKVEAKPWQPIKPLRKLNGGVHILPEATP